jgi:hypothetical protein
VFWGLDDPVPEEMHAFVLPGWRRTADVAWDEFSAVLKAYERHERQAHAEGAAGGWRAIMASRLGDGEGKLGFFKTTSIALYAARSGEPADEVADEMHEIIAAHPDLTAEREGQYTATWLLRELLRLRAKDAARRERRACAHKQGAKPPQPRRRVIQAGNVVVQMTGPRGRFVQTESPFVQMSADGSGIFQFGKTPVQMKMQTFVQMICTPKRLKRHAFFLVCR